MVYYPLLMQRPTDPFRVSIEKTLVLKAMSGKSKTVATFENQDYLMFSRKYIYEEANVFCKFTGKCYCFYFDIYIYSPISVFNINR